MTRHATLLLLLLLVTACAPERDRGETDPQTGTDAGEVDAGEVDAGRVDAGAPDAGACVPETDRELCTRVGRTCGEYGGFDNCDESRVVPSCGTCEDARVCRAGACVDQACEPDSDADLCQAAGRACGRLERTDRCGTARVVISCGGCDAGVCTEGQCVTCTAESDPVFCRRLGKDCSNVTAPDNCGRTRTAPCGSCGVGLTCGAQAPNECGAGTCTPEPDVEFCRRLGKNCGQVTDFDNCGNARTVAFCGRCEEPEKCGEGGVANVCGCVGESDASLCQKAGKNCGVYTGLDRCNRSRSVTCGTGTCLAPQTCGAETPNVCGCVSETDPAFCLRLGAACGPRSAPDNCGRSRTVANCGPCPGTLQCGIGGANKCGCPETNEELCRRLGAECDALAAATDACGQPRAVASCGACTAPESCGVLAANVCACAPETDAEICTAASRTCGLAWATDRCTQRRAADCSQCRTPAGSGLDNAGPAWATTAYGPARQGLSAHVGPVAAPSERWRFTATGNASGDASAGAVAPDGTVYVAVSYFGSAQPRPLVALRPDGTQKWSYTIVGGTASPPAIGPNGNVFLCSADAKLVCVTPQGAACAGTPVATGGGNCLTAPLVDRFGYVYVTGDTWLEGYSPSFRREFRTPLAAAVTGGPALGPDETLYVGNWQAELFAISSVSGAVKGKVALASTSFKIRGSPVVSTDGKLVYVAVTNGSVVALNAADQPSPLQVRWTFWPGAGYRARDIWGSPAVGPDGTIYVANMDGVLFAISPGGTGTVTQKWAYQVGGGFNGNEPYNRAYDYAELSPVVGADGTVYVLSHFGRLHAVSPQGSARFTLQLDAGASGAGALALGRDGRLLVPFSIGSNASVLGAFGTW